MNTFNNINYRELRLKNNISLIDMAKIMGLNHYQSYQKKEDGLRKFTLAEKNYFLLITGSHPTKKLVDINNKYVKLSPSEWFKFLIINLGIKTNYEIISQIFLAGGLNFKPNKDYINHWLNEDSIITLELIKCFINGYKNFNFDNAFYLENENFCIELDSINSHLDLVDDSFDLDNIDYIGIRKKSNFKLKEMAMFFGLSGSQAFKKKETTGSFTLAEKMYFLLITNSHPAKKLVDINDNFFIDKFFLSVFEWLNFTNFSFFEKTFSGIGNVKPSTTEINEWLKSNSAVIDLEFFSLYLNAYANFKKSDKNKKQ